MRSTWSRTSLVLALVLLSLGVAAVDVRAQGDGGNKPGDNDTLPCDPYDLMVGIECRKQLEADWQARCDGKTPTDEQTRLFCEDVRDWRYQWACVQHQPDAPKGTEVWCAKETKRRRTLCNADLDGPLDPAQRTACEERWRKQCRDGSPTAENAEFCADFGDRRYEEVCERSGSPLTEPDDAAWCKEERERREGPPRIIESFPDKGAPDVFTTLGGTSPFCKDTRRMPPQVVASCRDSGSIAHAYPITNYGLDIQVDDGVLNVMASLSAALQYVAAWMWMVFTYIFKGVLLLLEQAFALSVLDKSMPEVERSLLDLHENVIGQPWMLAALALAGLWGIWNGLIRQRVSQTLAGLAATVALMVGGLWMVYDPEATVGKVARLANDASMSTLNVASRFQADTSEGSLAQASQGLFDTMIVKPWCALQFGDVRWCLTERGGITTADAWLAFPAGGVERQGLYKLVKGDEPVDAGFFANLATGLKTWPWNWTPEDMATNAARRISVAQVQQELAPHVAKDPSKVVLQEQLGTYPRLALLAIVLFTMLGAILVLLFVAIRLLFAAVMVLLLLLFAPMMLLAPALGEWGRNAFLSYLKKLGANALAKFLWSIVLTVFVLVAGILAVLPIGWFAALLLQAVYWWGLFGQRGRLAAFASLDARGMESGGGGRGGLASFFYTVRSAQMATELAGAATGHPLRRIRSQRLATREAQEGLVRQRAQDELQSRARGALAGGAARDEERNRRLLATAAKKRARLAEIRNEQSDLRDQRADQVRRLEEARKLPKQGADLEQAELDKIDARAMELAADAERTERQLQSPAVRGAERAAQAGLGRDPSERDVRDWIEHRRFAVENLSSDHEDNLRAAGIDPAELKRVESVAGRGDFADYARRSGIDGKLTNAQGWTRQNAWEHEKAQAAAEKDALLRRSAEAMERDKDLLRRSDAGAMPKSMRDRGMLEASVRPQNGAPPDKRQLRDELKRGRATAKAEQKRRRQRDKVR